LFTPIAYLEIWQNARMADAHDLIGDDFWRLINATDDELPEIERVLQFTQAQAVDQMIEHSCWSADLPNLVGGRGTPDARRDALRAAYRAAHPPEPTPDRSRLTPLEFELANALQCRCALKTRIARTTISNKLPVFMYTCACA
jgi:hypothetical protein